MAETLNSFLVSVGINYSLSLTVAGANASVNNNNQTLSLNYKSAIADAAVGGASLLYYNVLTIAGSGAQTIVLGNASLIDPLNNTLTYARCKLFLVALLATTQSLNDGTVGTACTSITWGGAASHPAFQGAGKWLDDATAVITVHNGGLSLNVDGNAAGNAVVAGTSDQVLFTNIDTVNSAKILVVALGGSA